MPGRAAAWTVAGWLGAAGLLLGLAPAVSADEAAPRFEGTINADAVGDGVDDRRLELLLPDNRRASLVIGEALTSALVERGFALAPGAARVLTFEFKRDQTAQDDSPWLTLRGSGGSSSTPHVGARVRLPLHLWGDDRDAAAEPRAYVLSATVSDRDGTVYWRGRVTMLTDAKDQALIRRKMAGRLGAAVGETVIGRRFAE